MIEPFEQNPNVMAVVRIENGMAIANSKDVAAFFGKRHDNVLRKFDELDCSEDFRLLHFEETLISVPMPNGGIRVERSFTMTRDGFAFIAFRFTGKRAATSATTSAQRHY